MVCLHLSLQLICSERTVLPLFFKTVEYGCQHAHTHRKSKSPHAGSRIEYRPSRLSLQHPRVHPQPNALESTLHQQAHLENLLPVKTQHLCPMEYPETPLTRLRSISTQGPLAFGGNAHLKGLPRLALCDERLDLGCQRECREWTVLCPSNDSELRLHRTVW